MKIAGIPLALSVFATLLLPAAGWFGWQDVDPYMAQELVRESIRAAIGDVVRAALQYAFPVMATTCLFVHVFGRDGSRYARRG